MAAQNLKIDPAVDVVSPRPGALLFLTPEGPFTILDRHGLASRIVRAIEMGCGKDDIVKTLPSDAECAAAHELIALLQRRGVAIGDGFASAPNTGDPLRHWIRFGGERQVDGDLHVELMGDGLLANAVAKSLHRAGITISEGEVDALRIIALDTPDYSRLLSANAEAVSSGRRLLPVWLNRSTIHFGPSVIPGATACLGCLLHRRQAAKWRSESLDLELNEGVSVSPSLAEAASALALGEVLRTCLDAHIHTDYGMAYQFDFLTLRLTAGKVLPLPRCQACESTPENI